VLITLLVLHCFLFSCNGFTACWCHLHNIYFLTLRGCTFVDNDLSQERYRKQSAHAYNPSFNKEYDLVINKNIIITIGISEPRLRHYNDNDSVDLSLSKPRHYSIEAWIVLKSSQHSEKGMTEFEDEAE